MNEKFKIHLQGTADTRQWAAANGILGKLEGSADRFVDTLRAGVGIDLGGRLVSGLASLPGIFADTLKAGFDFNVSLHDSEIAISNVVQKFMGLNAEAGKNEAAKAMAQIIELEPKAAGTLQDLTSGFIASLAAAQAAGVSIEENIELVGLFANGLANAAIPAEQLVQEMRAVFSGNLGPDAAFGAGVLGLKNEDIRKAKEAGNLYQLLKERIGTLGVAGDSASVAMSSLGSAISKAQGILAKPLFQNAIQGVKDFTAVLDNPEVIKALTDIGVGIGGIVDMGTTLGRWAMANAEGIKVLTSSLVDAMIAMTGTRAGVEVLKNWYDGVKAKQMAADGPSRVASASPTLTVANQAGSGAASAGSVSMARSGGSGSGATTEDSFALALEKSRAALGDQTSQLMVLEEEYRLIVESMDKATTMALEGMDAAQLINAAFENQTGEPWSGEMLENLKAAAAKAAEIKTLKEQIDQQAIQENERLRKEAADTARANAEVKADEAKVALALDAEKAEIAITAAKAAGQDAVAKQLEDQQRINELARGYREELKLSASEAQALAEQRVTSERELSDRNEADPGGGGDSDLDRLIERAKESERRRKDRFKYSIANPGQEVSSIDQIKNNTIFEGGFYNNRGGGKATASRPDSSLTTGGPLTDGGGLAGLRDLQRNRFSSTSRLSDSSPLTPGGGLADFKANSGAVNTAGKGGADAVNLGPNGAASQAKGAADAMARLGTQITARDAATAAELSRLKGLVSELERRIAQNAQITANNRT
jgi:hypothetical protein